MCVGGLIGGGGVGVGVCVFESVMTSLSMHASIFCCVDFIAVFFFFITDLHLMD